MDERALTMKTTNQKVQPQSLGTVRALVLFFIVIFQPALAAWVLPLIGKSRLVPVLVETGVYSLIVSPLIVLAFSRETYSRRFWGFPSKAYVGILGVAGLQLLLNWLPVHALPLARREVFSALIASPIVEEILRATILFPLVSRWGRYAAVALVAILFAGAHPMPFYAAVQTTALTVALLWSEGSIPANMAAHALMNALVILHYGIATT